MKLSEVLALYNTRTYAQLFKKPDQPATCITTKEGNIVSTDSAMTLKFVNEANNFNYTGSYLNIDEFKKSITNADDYDQNHVYIEARKRDSLNPEYFTITHRYLVFGADEKFVDLMTTAVLGCITTLTNTDKNIYAYTKEAVMGGKVIILDGKPVISNNSDEEENQ